MTSLGDSDLHKLGTILAASSKASLNRRVICMALGFSTAEIEEMNRNYGSRNYEYFVKVLDDWRERNGKTIATVENLVLILEQERCVWTAGQIQEAYRAENDHAVAGPSSSRVATPTATVSIALWEEQKAFVTQNLSDVIGFTRDWELLAVQLVSMSLSSSNNAQKLDSKDNDYTKYYDMYIEIMKRRDFFEKLKLCLDRSGNTDALEILNQFVAKQKYIFL